MKGAIPLGLLLLATCGTGGRIGHGISHYRDHDYHTAIHIWTDLEPHEARMRDKGLVRYLVYRGLTHYRLGERAEALRYLERGQGAFRMGDPDWLPTHARLEMQEALTDLRR